MMKSIQHIEDLVSIIVPVYNTGLYLKRCINSIINQTYENIEVLLINDGSTDELTLDILERYTNDDYRVNYYNNQNMGIAKSRNFGLDHARGEYICFVDSDDYIDEDMIEEMVNRMKVDNSDLCQASFYTEYHHIQMRMTRLKNEVVSKVALLKGLTRNIGINNYLWGKVYRYYLFDDIRFDEDLKSFEDAEIMPKIMMKVEKASLMSARFYHYIKHQGSLTDRMNLKMANEMFETFKRQERYMNDNLKGEEFSNHENYYRSEMIMIYLLLFGENDKEVVENFNLPSYSKDNVNFLNKAVRNIMLKLLHLKYKNNK